MNFLVKVVVAILLMAAAYNAADIYFKIDKVQKPATVMNLVYAVAFFAGLLFVCGRALGGW